MLRHPTLTALEAMKLTGMATALAEQLEMPEVQRLGWTVDLSRFDEARILARRDAPPAVTVQVKLDKP